MRKIRSITAALVLGTALVVLAGCSASTQTTTNPTPSPTPAPTPEVEKISEVTVYKGVGQTPIFRVGPGKDENGGQIYSINFAVASAIFDKDGKILDVSFDGLEILSPNDKEHKGVPMFSGWPGQPAYLDGVSNTDDTAKAEISSWQTKRERGDEAYGMNWSEQFGFYEEFFKGKTVAEVEQWFAKNTSDTNGRPLNATKDTDKEKYAKLSEEEKAALADVVSGATISISDAHGDFLGALAEAYKNKQEITIPVK